MPLCVFRVLCGEYDLRMNGSRASGCRSWLSIQQAIECPSRGAPLVVVGAPLVIDGAAFRPADGNLFQILKKITDDIRKTPYRNFSRTV